MGYAVIDLSPMESDARREIVRAAARAARENPMVNMTGLAKAAGWAQSQLLNFVDRGTGSDRKVEMLANALRRLGILEDLDHALADQLRAFAGILDSPALNRSAKALLFRHFVESLHDSLASYVVALEEGKSDELEAMKIEVGRITHNNAPPGAGETIKGSPSDGAGAHP